MKKILLMLFMLFSLEFYAKEEKRQCKMGRDYWIYTPDKIDSKKTYWLVVGVHGYGGKGQGAAGLSGWANKYDNVIVTGPSFPSKGPYYQMLGGGTGKQLLNLHKDLGKEFKLHKKMFIYGFSGGSLHFLSLSVSFCSLFCSSHAPSFSSKIELFCAAP